jgi:hypothetical protein
VFVGVSLACSVTFHIPIIGVQELPSLVKFHRTLLTNTIDFAKLAEELLAKNWVVRFFLIKAIGTAGGVATP